MPPITEKQLRHIWVLLRNTEEAAYKDDYVYESSNGRTVHSSELTSGEAQLMIDSLRSVQQGERKPANSHSELGKKYQDKPHHGVQVPKYAKPTDEQIQENKLRRKILAMCHQLGWYRRDEHGYIMRNGYGKPLLDFSRIDAFCIKHGGYKKKFQQHTAAELTGGKGLIYQFTQLTKNTIEK